MHTAHTADNVHLKAALPQSGVLSVFFGLNKKQNKTWELVFFIAGVFLCWKCESCCTEAFLCWWENDTTHLVQALKQLKCLLSVYLNELFGLWRVTIVAFFFFDTFIWGNRRAGTLSENGATLWIGFFFSPSSVFIQIKNYLIKYFHNQECLHS